MQFRELFQEVKTSLLTMASLLIILCGFYPVVAWGLAQLAFPRQANGSLVTRQGQIIGSDLIAQNFTSPRFFHPRPSAAGDTGYDAANSGASNLGPLSRKLVAQVKVRIAAYRAENHLAPEVPIPADAVTASGSGLDPHISLKNAALQAPRVAAARGVSLDRIERLIDTCSAGPDLSFLGEPRVNVLRLNLALEALTNGSHGG